MIEDGIRFLKRLAVLLPPIGIFLFAADDIYEFFHHHLPMLVALFVTYVAIAYGVIPAFIRLLRYIFPPSHLPYYSTTPDGFASDPLNIGLFGTREEVIKAMTDIGWQVRLPGDANVNGKVDRDDFTLIDRGYAKHLTGWSNGDFNADGTIDAKDYQVIDMYYVAQTGAFDPDLLATREAQFGPDYAADLAAFVPEPSSAACVLAATGIAATRRRCRRPRV